MRSADNGLPRTTPTTSPGAAKAIARMAAAMLVLCCPALASAEIYCWTDASGTVTYSNLPPPKGIQVTDVIAETPVSPQAQADVAHRLEVSALNDRIRLLEFEMARAKREAVDYPAPAPALAPPGPPCTPDGFGDCDYPWSPYYTTGVLVRTRGAGYYHGYGHGSNHPIRHPAAASLRTGHVAAVGSGRSIR